VAWVWSQVKSCGSCGGQSGTGTGFPCQFSFHHVLRTHLSSRASTIGQLFANVPSGLSRTPAYEGKQSYGLCSQGVRIWFPAGRTDFSLLDGVQTSSEYYLISSVGISPPLYQNITNQMSAWGPEISFIPSGCLHSLNYNIQHQHFKVWEDIMLYSR
jgi:hypothetical protein